MIIRRKSKYGERGQVLILCAVSLVVLLLFVGLAIDFGMAYVTKARLGKAADAAALMGAKSLNKDLDETRVQSTNLAKAAFFINYGTSSGIAPIPVVAYTPSANGTLVSVQATATNKPIFLPLTLLVGASAQATRAHVMLTLVLDRSGSMGGNGGGAALPGAVSSFVDHFDDKEDSLAMVSFATAATTDIPMKLGKFQKAIKDAVKMDFNGHTFSDGGLKNAIIENNTPPPPGNIMKVVVFFTDGYANTIQDSLTCNGPTDPGAMQSNIPVTWSFGGYDSPDTRVGFMKTDKKGDEKCTTNGTVNTGITNTCCSATFAAASQGGIQSVINQPNVKAEAQFRAVADANALRAVNTIVYSIGLGNDINKDFLRQVANDPSSSNFNPNTPSGEAAFAPTPAELQAVFDRLAYKILLRITQ